MNQSLSEVIINESDSLITFNTQLKTALLLFSRVEDGIVLSPQRQSFVQGCHIPQSAPEKHLLQERGKISRTTDRENDGRSRLTGRVGRGRTLDYKERTPLKEKDKVFLPVFLFCLIQTDLGDISLLHVVISTARYSVKCTRGVLSLPRILGEL